MKNLLSRLLTCLAAFGLSSALAASYQQFDLFPLTLGSSWTYDDGGIALVSQATDNNGVLSVIITNKNTTPHGHGSLGLVADSSQVMLSGGGSGSANYIIFDGDMGYYPLVRIPMSLGQSWNSRWTANGYPAYQTSTVTDTSKPVTIGGNVFPNCIELTVITSFPQGYTPGQTRWVRNYYYFLSQVGCIKRILTSDDHKTNIVQAVSWDIKGSPQPVVISRQPQNQTVVGGTPATFSVAAYGAAAVKYQWRKNGSNIPGATSSSYRLASVQASSVGDYSVLVSNIYGSLMSSQATLTVIPPPDSTKPSVSITEPKSGARVTNAPAYTVRGVASDNWQVVGVGARIKWRQLDRSQWHNKLEWYCDPNSRQEHDRRLCGGCTGQQITDKLGELHQRGDCRPSCAYQRDWHAQTELQRATIGD